MNNYSGEAFHSTQIQKTFEDSETKLLRSLQTLEETKEIGANSCVLLNEHNEKLEKINDELDQIDVDLNRGERILRGMSFFGRVANFFTRDKTHIAFQPDVEKKRNAVKKNSNNEKIEQKEDIEDENTNRPSNSSSSSASKQQENAQIQRQNELLDALSCSLLDVKAMAGDISLALDEGDQRLDVLNAKTQRSDERMKKMNFKIWKKI